MLRLHASKLNTTDQGQTDNATKSIETSSLLFTWGEGGQGAADQQVTGGGVKAVTVTLKKLRGGANYKSQSALLWKHPIREHRER